MPINDPGNYEAVWSSVSVKQNKAVLTPGRKEMPLDGRSNGLKTSPTPGRNPSGQSHPASYYLHVLPAGKIYSVELSTIRLSTNDPLCPP